MEYDISELRTLLHNEYPRTFKRHEEITISTQGCADDYVVVDVLLELFDNHFIIAILCLELNDNIYFAIGKLVERCLEKKNDVVITSPEAGLNSQDLVFTKKVYIYTNKISLTKNQSLISTGGLKLEIRDEAYRIKIQESKRPDLFLCHDSRDKDFVRNLYGELTKLGLKVWFDEVSITPGNSSFEDMKKGIKDSTHCIAILSKNFLSNEKWAQRYEFVSFAAKEISTKQVIIPVWFDIEAFDLTATGDWWLSDKAAIRYTGNNIKQLAIKIKETFEKHKL